MSLNPVLNQVTNSTMSPPDFVNWTSAFTGPTLSTEWATLVSANGGTVTFPAFGGYTPASYTAPSTNAPSGNSVWVGWATARAGGVIYPCSLVKGTPYTLTFNYAGDSTRSTLNWYLSAQITTASGAIFGDNRFGVIYWTNFKSSVSGNAWLTKTLTFVADQTGTGSITIWGGGTDGTLTSGATNSVTISAGTVMAPVLLGNVQFTSQSNGARAFPPGALTPGSNSAALVAGNDTRLAYLDSFGLLHPRMERIDFATSTGITTSTTTNGAAVVQGGTIMGVDAMVGSFGGSGSVSVDVLLNGTSIFNSGGNPVVTTAGATNPGSFRGPQTAIGASASVLSIAVLAASGTPTALTVTVWVYYP